MAHSSKEKFLSSISSLETANDNGDSKAALKFYSEMLLALKELRETDDKGNGFLYSLLDYADFSVVSWAALAMLTTDERLAVAALKKVAEQGQGMESFGARITLDEWFAGRLKTI
jgi:hypothetical protein